jgi:hypothetical protein
MARAGLATMLALAIVCTSVTARGQARECDGCRLVDLRAPEDFPDGPTNAELEGLLAFGASLATTSYVFGVTIAHGEPHSTLAVDTIPIIGPIVAAARNADDYRNASVLTFLAGAQAMGLIIVAAAASDLAELKRLHLSLSAGPTGCGIGMSWRLP